MSAAYCESTEILKDLQNNLAHFTNAVQQFSNSLGNIAIIMGKIDHFNQISKNLLDWSQSIYESGQSLFTNAEAFDIDGREYSQAETITRTAISSMYERLHFFLNFMTQSYIDFSRSESPMSSFECQIQNLGVVQQNNRFRNNFKCRRWSEVPCSKAEKVIKENRRWSMPVSSRVVPMMNKLAGSVPEETGSYDGVIDAIQLLSFKTASRPPSQQCQQSNYSVQQQYCRSQSQRQRQQRAGEINEILVLPRINDPLYLGRYQQIVENSECDEY